MLERLPHLWWDLITFIFHGYLLFGASDISLNLPSGCLSKINLMKKKTPEFTITWKAVLNFFSSNAFILEGNIVTLE